MGTVIGLNYQSAEFLLKLYKVKCRRSMMEDIMSIERGALDAFGRMSEKRTAKNGA